LQRKNSSNTIDDAIEEEIFWNKRHQGF